MEMLPFTREQFFEVFVAYNADTWPAALMIYPLALGALVAAWRSGSRAGFWVGVVLAVMWAWVGLVYHGVYFSRINPAAPAFAVAFLLQALFFGLAALRGRGLTFATRSRQSSVVGAVLIGYAMVAYPLIGLLTGEHHPAVPLFGVAPCPLVIFTFGLLVWASSARWWLWIVPILWVLIGGSAFFTLSIPQDAALPVAAAAALLVWVRTSTNGLTIGPVPDSWSSHSPEG
jgi:hypothetical protein